MTTILRGLPSGAALVLQVGDSLPFVSRTIAGGPLDGERVVELLLDGQQRLTAMWKSLNDIYDDRTYLVKMPDDILDPTGYPIVEGISRYRKDGVRYPAWVDKPEGVLSRGYIPLKLLRPLGDDVHDEIEDWVDKSSPDDTVRRQTKRHITKLREKVREFNLPFLYLPPETPKEVALEVFIKMNTSSVELTTFDIIVAQVEGKLSESLHDLVTGLVSKQPSVQRYRDPEKLVLDVAALFQDRSPSQAGYWSLDLAQMVDDWPEIVDCIGEACRFLEDEMVFDSQRLPTDAVLPVLSALMRIVPEQPDLRGNARVLMKKYAWRSFLTSRYEQAAATAALQDYRGIRDVITGVGNEASIPLFNEDKYPLPEVNELIDAGWPKGKNILARGILALALHCGAKDIADGAPVRPDNIKTREYHHLFPDAILRANGLTDQEIYKSLNCALITWKTNRVISAKNPVAYLRERVDAGTLGLDALKDRLSSHLIPYESLNSPVDLTVPQSEVAEAVRKNYRSFLETRAAIIRKGIDKAVSGHEFGWSMLMDA